MGCPLTGLVAGIDESGRGPLAGPVVSSCVVWRGLPEIREKVADSKLLSEKQRTHLYGWIREYAIRVGIGIASHMEIETMNIHRATLLSMERALRDTGSTPDTLLIDGVHVLKSSPTGKAVVRGDRKCFFIACASIVAKVVRDRIMDMYDMIYPGYGFTQHKGYPTEHHRMAIRRLGLSPIHRKTFKGVREYVPF